MQITINGQPKAFEADQSLKNVITQVSPNSERVIAELNGDIVKSPEWDNTEIKDGDSLELVSFVGGG